MTPSIALTESTRVTMIADAAIETADMGASLIVIFNGLRLLRSDPWKRSA